MMNKKLIIFGAILLCATLFVAVKLVFFGSSGPDRAVLKFAKDMNKTCPTMVDVETRLDKVTAQSDNSLHFDYTLVNHVKDSLPVENLKKYMDPVILNKIKTSPVLSKFLDKKLTWFYSYNDRKGEFIFMLSYTPEQLR